MIHVVGEILVNSGPIYNQRNVLLRRTTLHRAVRVHPRPLPFDSSVSALQRLAQFAQLRAQIDAAMPRQEAAAKRALSQLQGASLTPSDLTQLGAMPARDTSQGQVPCTPPLHASAGPGAGATQASGTVASPASAVGTAQASVSVGMRSPLIRAQLRRSKATSGPKPSEEPCRHI